MAMEASSGADFCTEMVLRRTRSGWMSAISAEASTPSPLNAGNAITHRHSQHMGQVMRLIGDEHKGLRIPGVGEQYRNETSIGRGKGPEVKG